MSKMEKLLEEIQKDYELKWWEKIWLPIYRFFKFRWVWDIGYGIANLWKWKGIVWRNREWDDHFLWAFIHHKLKLMEQHYHPNSDLILDFEGREEVYSQIRQAREKMEKVVRDEYNENLEEFVIAVKNDGLTPVEKDIKEALGIIAKHGRKWWD